MPEVECSQCSEKFSSRNKLFAHLSDCKRDQGVSVSGSKRKVEGSTETNFVDNEENASNQKLEDFVIPTLLRIHGDSVANPFRIVSKPQGIATQSGQPCITAHDDLGLFILASDTSDNTFPLPIRKRGDPMVKGCIRRALPVHRLDQQTGGLLICSESPSAEKLLKQFFRDRLVQKRYRALLHGRIPPPREGELIDNGCRFITSDVDGKPSRTAFFVVEETPSERHGYITTVDLFPITGRKHQLRKHCRELGCPIIGDPRYGQANTWPSDRKAFPYLFLWALEIRFPDPNAALEGHLEEQPLWALQPPSRLTQPTEPDVPDSAGYYRCVIPEPEIYQRYREI